MMKKFEFTKQNSSPMGEVRRGISRRVKTAFTLAEVLITLGIIGVVAAMTIPTLIANTNGQRYRSQFKKTVSTLNQAVRMAQAQYDFNFADLDDPFAEGMEDCAKQNPEQVKTICSLFNGTLTGATYLGIIGDNEELNKVYKDRPFYASNENIIAWSLADGALFALNTGKLSWYTGTKKLDDNFYNETMMGFIDVNGISKPNKWSDCSNDNDLGFDEGGVQSPCVVKTKDIHDIFLVYLYDTSVIPASSSAAYVFNTAK
ncbi:type II secretion system protein [bacterium]|nr:type II secretion system protein [bacterium]